MALKRLDLTSSSASTFGKMRSKLLGITIENQILCALIWLSLTLRMYKKIPYGKMYKSYPAVKELAELMGRSPSTVAIRLSNFASCDLILKERNIKGMADGRKRCQPFWDEFFQNKDALIYESERILAELQGMTIESKYEKEFKDILLI